MRFLEIPPKPSSLIESMRDIGYSLSTALADLIDNSVAAQARDIHIFVSPDASNLSVGILDDGIGMTEDTLLDAMRLGSRNPLEERAKSDLGRFGLGLKTASFSQCRILTVVTRTDGTTACARWDLDHIAETDRWRVQVLDDMEPIPWVEHLGPRGTLVVWEKLDLGEDEEGSGGNMDEFVRQMDVARYHLELVFHRFLAGEPGCRKVRISLNNRPLQAFDPFHSRHPATISGPEEKIRVSGEDVRVQSFTLPHHSKVKAADWERYAGPEGYVRNQGFYVYREKRLIIHGTWFGLARQTEITKLARIRIDMPNSLDGAWKIDVKKASAQLPAAVRDRLRRIVEPLQGSSKRVYTSRGRRLVEENRIPVWVRVQNKNQISYQINPQHPIIIDFMEQLSPKVQGDLKRIMDVAGASLPMDALFADLGGDNSSIMDATIGEDALRHAALTTFDRLVRATSTRHAALAMMRVAEPFRSNWEQTVQIIDTAHQKGFEDD